MKYLAVVPTYNEAENIEALVRELLSLGIDIGVLVVDDGSPDGTGALADELARNNPLVHVMHRSGKLGLGSAYVQGFKWGLANTDARVLVQMDADFSHPPNKVPELAAAAEKGKVAVGSRYVAGGGVKNWGLGRRLLSRWGSLYARTVLGLSLRDVTGGFKAWPRKALESMDLDSVASDGYAFQAEMSFLAHRAGIGLNEVPFVFEDRRVGQSKMSLAIALEAFWIVWLIRFKGGGKRV